MRDLAFAYCAVPALLIATFGCHQSRLGSPIAAAASRPGVSFDQSMVTVSTASGRTDTATTVMHTTSVGGNTRIDLEKGSFAKLGPFSAGPHAVMIMRDGGQEIFFVNPNEKQYVSINLVAMMDGMQKMLESMGGSMTMDTSGTRVTLDSLGAGPAIDGHPTLTYRVATIMRMKIPMMGESRVVDNRSTQEIQVATDLGDFAYAAGMNRFAEITQTIGFPKAALESMVATRRRMHGFPLRAVAHTTGSVNGMTRTVVQTIDTRNVKRLAVPDSLFAIPADYKPVTMPMMPGMPAR
jgi:hypothetical protein